MPRIDLGSGKDIILAKVYITRITVKTASYHEATLSSRVALRDVMTSRSATRDDKVIASEQAVSSHDIGKLMHIHELIQNCSLITKEQYNYC